MAGEDVRTDGRTLFDTGGQTAIVAPRRIGPYELGGRLGTGGRAEVFLAVDPQGREVAVKVLTAAGGDEEARRRFDRELRTLAELDPPSIVRVVGHGIDETARPPTRRASSTGT
ncbi:hypothetical protein HY251_04920 [bacterium]|nr:hypothetical protein [bacterium]